MCLTNIDPLRLSQLLHQALQNLFGLDLFNSSIRITDHQGYSILPSVWSDLLEPDMTIIVDTCSLQAENSPAIFHSPKPRSFSPPLSPTYTIRESEDSCDDNGRTYITPRGMVRKAVPAPAPMPMPMPPKPVAIADRGLLMGRLENRTQEVEEEERKKNSVDMFTGVSPEGSWGRERERQSTADKREKDSEKKGKKRNVDARNRQKSKYLKSISRFARAVLYVLSAGTIQPSSKEEDKRPEKPKRVIEKPRRTITMEAIENNSRSNILTPRTLSERRTVPISGRRGISPLPHVVLPAIHLPRNHHDFNQIAMIPPELAFIRAEPRRSKSLSHVRFPSPIATSAPSPVVPTRRGLRSKSLSSARNNSILSVISPLSRPSLDLGTNAEYKGLRTNKTAIQEVFSDMDGDTLGARSRSGTGDTAFTNVSSTPTLCSLDVRYTGNPSDCQ